MKVSIMNNILTYNDKSVTMKRKIIDYIVMSEYLIILEDFTGDDYNLVYCFDNELHKLWKIKKPDSKFIGQKQLPYVGITITKGLTVVDTLGRYFTHRPTILQTMVLSLGRMQRTATRWTYLCFARKRLHLCLWLTVIL